MIDLIKIDVEGFELKVLKGARKLMQKSTSLFVEVDDNNLRLQGDTAHDLISFLESYFNHIFIAESGQKVKSTDDFTNCHYDVIAQNED